MVSYSKLGLVFQAGLLNSAFPDVGSVGASDVLNLEARGASRGQQDGVPRRSRGVIDHDVEPLSGSEPSHFVASLMDRPELAELVTLVADEECGEHSRRIAQHVLGVDPLHQGRGLGSSLVWAGIERANRDQAPTYVDTSAERNVDFYERFGFEVVEKINVTDFDLPFWMMARAPHP